VEIAGDLPRRAGWCGHVPGGECRRIDGVIGAGGTHRHERERCEGGCHRGSQHAANPGAGLREACGFHGPRLPSVRSVTTEVMTSARADYAVPRKAPNRMRGPSADEPTGGRWSSRRRAPRRRAVPSERARACPGRARSGCTRPRLR
jgi:hypothetical protein